MPNYLTHRRIVRRKKNGGRIITKKIGGVQTNLNGNTTDIIIRPDNLRLMNGFPGPEKFLPKGLAYVRKQKLRLTIEDKETVFALANEHIFLREAEVKPMLRCSPKIREINRLANLEQKK